MLKYGVHFCSPSRPEIKAALKTLHAELVISRDWALALGRLSGRPPFVVMGPQPWAHHSWRKVVSKRVGLIRSPFVFKKSGEAFFIRYYQVTLDVRLFSQSPLLVYRPQGGLRFALRQSGRPFAFNNVDVRITTRTQPFVPE
jgi:hypothetical protein